MNEVLYKYIRDIFSNKIIFPKGNMSFLVPTSKSEIEYDYLVGDYDIDLLN